MGFDTYPARMTDDDTGAKDGNRRAMTAGAGVAVGAGVGAALFAATSEPVWIAIGVAIGAAVGTAIGSRKADG